MGTEFAPRIRVAVLVALMLAGVGSKGLIVCLGTDGHVGIEVAEGCWPRNGAPGPSCSPPEDSCCGAPNHGAVGGCGVCVDLPAAPGDGGRELLPSNPPIRFCSDDGPVLGPISRDPHLADTRSWKIGLQPRSDLARTALQTVVLLI